MSSSQTRYFNTASETRPLGDAAGYISLGAGLVQAGLDCARRLLSTACALDFASLGIGVGSQLSNLSDMMKALLGLGSSLLGGFAFLEPGADVKC